MKVATTFGASKIQNWTKEYKEGIKLGKYLSQKGYIVKCGGYQGLMEAVSKGVYGSNGICIGVTIELFDKIRPKNPYLSKKIVCKNLYERLKTLIEDSSIFIAQPGSIGTLNEIFMVLALKYGGFKPDIKIFLIGKMYKEMLNCSFIDENFKNSVIVYEDVDEFIKKCDI